jgi:hypothetical protein
MGEVKVKTKILMICGLFLGLAPSFVLASGTAEPETFWNLAKIQLVKPLETFPLQYEITYERLCYQNQADAHPLKFLVGNELVIGVALKSQPSMSCSGKTLEKIMLDRVSNEPQSIKFLQ